MELTAQIVALYLGQKCRTPDGIGVLCGISQDGIVKVEFGAFGPDFEVSHTLPFVKPILRRLESLTEAEARELYKVYISDQDYLFSDKDLFINWWNDTTLLQGFAPFVLGFSGIYLKLLSWGFDLFNLIDSGAAIDAATLEKNDEI